MPPTHSLLFSLLLDLSYPEYQAFRRWLRQRPGHLSDEYERVTTYLRRLMARGIEGDWLDHERLYRTCLPGKTYSPGHWRRWQHGYRKVLEKFLIDERRAKEASPPTSELLALYQARGLDRHYKLTLDKAIREASKSDRAGAEQLLERYQLETIAHRKQLTAKRRDRGELFAQDNLLSQALLAFELRQVCQLLAWARLQKKLKETPQKRAAELLQRAEQFPDEPAIRIYTLAVRLYLANFQRQGDRAFIDFQTGLDTDLHRFSPEEQRDLLLIAVNHALRQANAGRREYLARLFELYRRGLEDGILLENGRLSIFTFTNAFGAALQVGQMAWAEGYLLGQQSHLPPERGQEVVALARARLAYLREDYDQVLRELQRADYRDFIHHMTARLMQLKAYLALDYYHLADTLVNGTRQLLRRHNERSYHYKNYRNIFSLSARLLRLEPGKEAAKTRLIERISTTTPCTEKAWLLGQLGVTEE